MKSSNAPRVETYQLIRVAMAGYRSVEGCRLCLLSAKGTRRCGAGSAVWRIETTSCAVDAEGHL